MSLTDAFLLDPPPLDVWFALRADGAKGSGTEEDPWNGNPRLEPAFAVTSLTSSGREATANTGATNDNYSDGDVVTIAGVTGPGAQYYNGAFVIYSVMTNSFKYWMRGTPGGTAPGTITCAGTIYQFDEIFALLGANTAIHLGPGEFLTRGYGESAGGAQPKSGQKISGSGIWVTT